MFRCWIRNILYKGVLYVDIIFESLKTLHYAKERGLPQRSYSIYGFLWERD